MGGTRPAGEDSWGGPRPAGEGSWGGPGLQERTVGGGGPRPAGRAVRGDWASRGGQLGVTRPAGEDSRERAVGGASDLVQQGEQFWAIWPAGRAVTVTAGLKGRAVGGDQACRGRQLGGTRPAVKGNCG